MLAREAAEQALLVEAGGQREAKQEEGELNLAADQALRGIYGSDLRRIREARVELAGVVVAPTGSVFRSNRFCWLS